ncbi:MAG: hypothetical protein H6825_09775 [Planctomycetes bacterium]|nr:hypothetical protein [Planctomycetota bacterium]
MTDATDPAARTDRQKVAHRGWLIFFCFVILTAAVCFAYKFYEFFYDLAQQEGFRFAGAHLATYLLVSAGFFLLLLYAFLKGHFSDIERPKIDILEREMKYDHDEFA